jgi:hypothetical protein
MTVKTLVRKAKSLRTATAASLGLLSAAACGGGGGSSAGPTPPAQKVDQPFEVYNSNGTRLGNVTYSQVDKGSLLSVTAADLQAKGISTGSIDGNYLVARNPPAGTVGDFKANTTNGQLSIPATGETMVIYGLNASNHADYGCAFATPGFGQRLGTRYASVRTLQPGESFPLPGVTVIDGNDSWITQGLAKINEEIDVGGVKYGSLSWVGDSPSGNLAGGFAANLHDTNGNKISGYHQGGKFVIEKNQNEFGGIVISVEEAFEEYSGFDDLCGQDTNKSLFNTGSSQITPKGADYLRAGTLFSR